MYSLKYLNARLVTNSLFIGRFQPLHIGHLADIKSIIEKGERCIVAIAAANKAGTFQNPLTGDEREHIIKETLAAETDLDQTQYEVHQLTDIDDDEKWVRHVVNNLPAFEKVYSGSEYVRGFFENDERFEVFPVKMIKDSDGGILCATNIRKKFLLSENCSEYLHPKTSELLDKLAFPDRLVKITPD